MTAAEQDHASNGLVHVLHPGGVACGARGDRFETLLGSCVAVVLADPRRTVGAMCHIVHALPAPAGRHDDATYADVALRRMNVLLREHGLQPGQCEAYVYGGGNMFPDRVDESHVGDHNGRSVLDRLQQDGVHIVHVDLGGTTYRKLGWTIGPGMPEVTAVAV